MKKLPPLVKKERIKESAKKHYLMNRERKLLKQKQYYSEHKKERLEYYFNNKEILSGKHKKWASKNRAMINSRASLWRKENVELIRELNSCRKAKRHASGFNKKYLTAPRGSKQGVSYTEEYKKTMRARRRALDKDLNIRTVQLVYEDNIKRYGTLTCYLCLTPIVFKKDHLEHRTPLCRGGTNEYDNLGVACQICNLRKHSKTVEEFLRKETF